MFVTFWHTRNNSISIKFPILCGRRGPDTRDVDETSASDVTVHNSKYKFWSVDTDSDVDTEWMKFPMELAVCSSTISYYIDVFDI